ncbi:MAG: TRAP transporter large permease [Alphaproteobacteria bacterium]|nr:TRAP transporter large permease [Alphaproteobacteria bacterium]
MIWVALAFILLLACGVPIAFTMGLAGAVGLWVLDLRPVLLPQRMFNGVDSFILLAAPFYILAGELMGRAGITERLVKLSMLITGRVKGGTAYGSVVSAVFFSGISGTAVGDAAALGQIFIKEMPKEGYKTEYAAAVVVAGSMIGPIVPPSVTMVIYSAVSQVSIIDLFTAGIVPGLVLAGSIATVIFLQGLRRGLPRSRFQRGDEPIAKIIVEGLLVAMLPVLLFGGALSGVFTTTEAGGMAVLYTLLIGRFVFRKLRLADIWQALIVTARISASIYLILAAAEVLSYVMAVGGINEIVRHIGASFSGSPALFLLAIALFLIVVGTFLEPGPAIVIFVPLLIPVVKTMGIDPLQFAIVFILTLALGLSTPPIGLCLFIACRIGNIKMSQLFRALWPFFIAEKVVVILLCLVPFLSTWLPRLHK